VVGQPRTQKQLLWNYNSPTIEMNVDQPGAASIYILGFCFQHGVVSQWVVQKKCILALQYFLKLVSINKTLETPRGVS